MPEVTVLNNNFRVITSEMLGVESVTVVIRCNVGSRFESNTKAGISHFLEHMAFKGTSRRTAQDIAREFDDIGGHFNAQTGRESTTYYAKVLRRDLPIAIDILADIITSSSFPSDELEREKGVVVQEIFQVNDNPSDLVSDKFIEYAYAGEVFGSSILGTEDSVNSMTRDDLLRYVADNYFGSNMMLTAAGDLSHTEVVALAEGAFSSINDRQLVNVRKPNYHGGEYREERDLEQINLIIGFPAISYHDPSYATLMVLDCVMGGGMSSRLFQEVREKRGLAYTVHSFASCYSDTGVFACYAGTDELHIAELLNVVSNEFKKITVDISEDEVNRARERLKREVLMAYEGTTAMAQYIGHCYARYGRYVTKEELIQRYNAVSIDGVRKMADHFLVDSSKLTVASIGRLKNMPLYSDVVGMFA